MPTAPGTYYFSAKPVPGLPEKKPSYPGYNFPNGFVSGIYQKIIRSGIWLNILWVAFRQSGKPMSAYKRMRRLKQLRDRYRNDRLLVRYAHVGRRYFVNYNMPGWPSAAFNRYITHQLNRLEERRPVSLHTLVFAITKKCGFQCEHCCEWLNLNQPETLSPEDLLAIIRRFHDLGIAQLQLSGGEPLNRLKDILYLLDKRPRGMDCWLYTSGYSLTRAKAFLLKKHGLTGITISLDDYREEEHDRFRGVKGAYHHALQATAYARKAGLAVCYSICATKEFISSVNLSAFVDHARKQGVTFIQVLEPKAVGRYAGKDVLLTPPHQALLENLHDTINYSPAYFDYPLITYPAYNSRRMGCSGSGMDYVYADTDGDVHRCPFCQQKLFSAMDADLPARLSQIKTNGCPAYSICSTLNPEP